VTDARFVVNASPIIFLAAVDALSLLPQLVGEIVVPRAVLGEVLAPKVPHPVLLTLPSTAWVHLEEDVAVPAAVAGWDLGAGESQVLALALSRRGSEVVLDDLQARRCAQSLRLPTTGTLGVILRAKRRGLIPAARPIVEKLLERSFYLAHDLLEAALAQVGE
jgi:predicted nucleic acid-binding protein